MSASANICGRIRHLRIAHAGKRGKAGFARQLGLSPSTYDYYENTRVPPAEVLVRIADLTGADLRWLLTGDERPSGVSPRHGSVERAARLLSEHPHAAEPLAAFVEMLSAAMRFPPKAQSPAAAEPPPQTSCQGWIPILGRSAAGVPQFWARQDDQAGLTSLDELVRRMPPRHTQPAQAQPDDRREGVEAVQIVTLDAPLPPGTAEFLIAPSLQRRHERLFAVRIDGQSMEPDIRHADLVVLSPDCPAEPGKPAVAQLAGQIGVTCKLFRPDGAFVHLIPVNEQFPPCRFPREQLIWALRVLARVRPTG